MPSLFWRFASIITMLALISSEPGFDQFWTAHAQCNIPSNASTPTTRYTYFTYDFDGRLTQVNCPEGVINYGYDLATGRLTETCTQNSQVEYSYDALGRLQTVNVLERNGAMLTVPEVTTYGYDAVGNRQSVQLPNGIVTTYLYDNLNRLTNLTYVVGTTNLSSYSYKLDATGRRTNAVEILRQEDNSYLTNTLTWQFDGMYRLTNEVSICSTTSASYTNSYSYDRTGNRVKQIRIAGGSTTTTDSTYNDNDHLLKEVIRVNGSPTDTNSYTYDLNGSLVGKTNSSGVVIYTYNLANKLNSVTAGSVTTSYVYNDLGIRVSSTTGSSTKYYLIDANNHTGYAQVLEELAAVGGTPGMSYVIGDDVLAQATSSTVSYLLYDGHGSTRQLASGINVTSRYNYDAYGTVQTATSSSTAEYAVDHNITSKLYCGEQYDSNLHMYNLRARYYNPATGTFNQRDTFAGNNFDPQSLHKYAYANCDPVNGTDPSGNFTLVEVVVCVGILALGTALLTFAYVRGKSNNNARWLTLIIYTHGIGSIGGVTVDWNHVKQRIESQTKLSVRIETGSEIQPRPKDCRVVRIELGQLDGDQLGVTVFRPVINFYEGRTKFDEDYIKKLAAKNGFEGDAAKMGKFVENIVTHEMVHAAGVPNEAGEGSHPAVNPSDVKSLMYGNAYAIGTTNFRFILTTQDLEPDDYSVQVINGRIGNEK